MRIPIASPFGVCRPMPRRVVRLEAAEPALSRAVERHVPGHHRCALPETKRSPSVVASRRDLVDLADEDRRIDDAARPDRAGLSRDDTARELSDLVRLAVDHDLWPAFGPPW